MKHTWWRRQPSSYCYGPIVQGRLLTHHSGGDHGDEEGLRRWFPSPAGCQEELLDPPDLASMMAMACNRFRGKLIGALGFSHQGDYIGGRAASGSGPWGLTPWWRGQGLACAALGCGQVLAPLHLWFGLWLMFWKNRRFSFYFIQFREYFMCSFSKTKKQQITGNWHCGVSLVG
jgi:hypothetical protein